MQAYRQAGCGLSTSTKLRNNFSHSRPARDGGAVLFVVLKRLLEGFLQFFRNSRNSCILRSPAQSKHYISEQVAVLI